MNKNAVKKINEITIIGPGLIGSSLGLALKERYIKKLLEWINPSQILKMLLKIGQLMNKEQNLMKE